MVVVLYRSARSESCVLSVSRREIHEHRHQRRRPLRADCLHRPLSLPVHAPVQAHPGHAQRLHTHQHIASRPLPSHCGPGWGEGSTGHLYYWTWDSCIRLHHLHLLDSFFCLPLSIGPTLELFQGQHCGKLLRWGEAHMGLPERVDTILN